MVVVCYAQKGKSKSDIVCLCGLQRLCLVTNTRENLKAILYVFADCNDCVC